MRKETLKFNEKLLILILAFFRLFVRYLILNMAGLINQDKFSFIIRTELHTVWFCCTMPDICLSIVRR